MKQSVFAITVFAVSFLAAGAASSGAAKGNSPVQPETPEATTDPLKSASAKKPTSIAVVVSKKNPLKSLNVQEVEHIFLRKKTVWPNRWAITVYERHSENPIRGQFSKLVLGKEPSGLREYWLNLKLTRGLKAPKACRSAKLVKQYLARVKGGIGYMYERHVDDTVKVVAIIVIEGEEKGD